MPLLQLSLSIRYSRISVQVSKGREMYSNVSQRTLNVKKKILSIADSEAEYLRTTSTIVAVTVAASTVLGTAVLALISIVTRAVGAEDFFIHVTRSTTEAGRLFRAWIGCR